MKTIVLLTQRRDLRILYLALAFLHSTERANQTIEQMLRAYVSEDQDNWDECLDQVEFAYNNSRQASTGHSPFFLNYGENPRTPVQIAMQSKAANKVPSTMGFLKKMNRKLQSATTKTAAAQDRQKTFADQHRREQTYQVGDQVWLSTANLRLIRPRTKKLAKKFKGPYTVTQIISSNAYKLDLRGTMRVHPVFHTSQLKPFKDSDMYPRNIDIEKPGPIEEFEDGSKTFAMDKIIGSKKVKGKTYYRIRWKGSPPLEDTWLPERELKHVQGLLKLYKKRNKLP